MSARLSTTQLFAWKGSVSADWALLQTHVAQSAAQCEAIAQLQTTQQSLQLVTNDLKTELASASSTLCAAEQRLLVHTTTQAQELQEQLHRDVERVRTSDKKLARQQQQLRALSDKLGELDQVVKLVGKQLIENTNRLHALRSEQHAQRQVRRADELALQFVAPVAANEEPETATSEGWEKRADENETTALLELRSQHEALRDAIRDKLRHYEHVLQPQPQSQQQEEEEE